jgi:hypothetical protein
VDSQLERARALRILDLTSRPVALCPLLTAHCPPPASVRCPLPSHTARCE